MGEAGLNTLQLRHALTHNLMTQSYFDGIYPLDELKSIETPPKMIVVNTDPSYKPGKHWMLFFRDNDVMELFDSLGRDLSDMEADIKTFAHRFNDTVKYVSQRVQPVNSSLCGHYCLYFAHRRCDGHSMNDIVSDIPSPSWIKECVPILFDIPGIISECQTCDVLV